MSRREVILVLQDVSSTLRGLRLPGVDDAVRRASTADEGHLSMTVGSWHKELRSLVDDLREQAGDVPVTQIKMAKALGIKLPELPGLLRLIKDVTRLWDDRPGVLRAG